MNDLQAYADGVADLVAEELAKCWCGLSWHCEAKVENLDAMVLARAEIVVNGVKHVFRFNFKLLGEPDVVAIVVNIGLNVKQQLDRVLVDGEAFECLLKEMLGNGGRSVPVLNCFSPLTEMGLLPGERVR